MQARSSPDPGYPLPVGRAGTGGFSLGYAYLDTEYSQDNVAAQASPNGFGLGEFSLQSGATGLGYGMHWNYRLSEHLQLTADARHQRYKSSGSAVMLDYAFGENFPVVEATPTQLADVKIRHEDVIFMIGITHRR